MLNLKIFTHPQDYRALFSNKLQMSIWNAYVRYKIFEQQLDKILYETECSSLH